VSTTITLVTGWPAARPIQCYLVGSGTVPAQYNFDDILTAAVFPRRSTIQVFAPSIGWYTAAGTQTGYDQGQVEPTFSAVQVAMLEPSIRYTLAIYRALVNDPVNPEVIARVPITVEPLAYP
jgi:hypothetical protein